MNIDKIQYQYEDSLREWTTPKRVRIYEYFKINPISTFIDIGANTGGSINIISKNIPLKTVIGFEPDIDNFNFLNSATANIAGNRFLYNIGIYYGLNESKVYGAGDNAAGGYMVDINSSYRPDRFLEYENKVFKLDTLENIIEKNHPQLIGNIDLIKIDVEGSEYNIIENSKLLKMSKYLFIEFHVQDMDYIKQFISKHLNNYVIIFEDFREVMLKRKE